MQYFLAVLLVAIYGGGLVRAAHDNNFLVSKCSKLNTRRKQSKMVSPRGNGVSLIWEKAQVRPPKLADAYTRRGQGSANVSQKSLSEAGSKFSDFKKIS